MNLPSKFLLYARPGKPMTRIISYDEKTHTLILDVASPPIDGRANDEIIRFFKKELKKKATIVSGYTAKKKIIVLE